MCNSVFWAESVSHGLHMAILCRKKIHIRSKAKIVWHVSPRDRWCHLHPQVRIVPARFVDNDLFKWEWGKKNPWAPFHKYRTFTAIENHENEALLRAAFSHWDIALRMKTRKKICPHCNSNLLLLSCHPALFPKMYLSHRVNCETASLHTSLLLLPPTKVIQPYRLVSAEIFDRFIVAMNFQLCTWCHILLPLKWKMSQI